MLSTRHRHAHLAMTGAPGWRNWQPALWWGGEVSRGSLSGAVPGLFQQYLRLELEFSVFFKPERKTYLGRDICTPMFTAALVTIAEEWKQPKCPWTDEWISKMCCTHAMEYYSVLKRKAILSYAAPGMSLGDIMLGEIRQSQKDKYCVILLIWGI